MKRVSIPFALLALAVLGVQAGETASWPQFRGPNRDDISTETGLLKKWPAEGPKLLWKATGIGKGYSTVSIAGGKIFTMGDMADGSYVHALDMSGQKILWSTKVGAVGRIDRPGTRATPTVDGVVLYTLDENGVLVCLQTADGKEVWSKDLKKDFGGQMMSGWGYSESPLVDGNLLVCTPGGKKGTMLALDKKTGAPVWQSAEILDKAAYSSIIAADIGGVHQFIQLTDKSVFGVDAKTGKKLWLAPCPGRTAVIPTPIYYDGYVFVAAGYGVGCNCFKITAAGNEFKAEPVYTANGKDMVNHHGGVVRVGEYVYGHSDNGGWTCMEMKTGKVMWKNPGVGKGSVTVADGMLFMRSEGSEGGDDSIIAIAPASPDGYKELSRFTQPNRSKPAAWPHPVVFGGKLYIRDQDVLMCFDVKNN